MNGKGSPAAMTAPGRDPGYFELTRDLSVSLILVLPLLALYQAGLLFTRFRIVNGVDFLTRFVYGSWGTRGVVLLNLVVIAVFLAAIIRLERRRRFRPGLFAPLVLESAIYASLLSTAILFVMQAPARIFPSAALPPLSSPPIANLVLSIGAGVHEEIVFRLVLIGVLQYVFADLLGARDGAAFAIAAVASSLLFAGAHHVGRFGEVFAFHTFAFRALAGLIFAAIVRWRSFAVAAYTHAIYDILVFFR